MRSTCLQAVSNSSARPLPMRALELRQDFFLGLASHGDDEGEAEAGDVGGVELGEQLALVVGQRIEPGGSLFAWPIPRSAAWPAPACRQGRDGR